MNYQHEQIQQPNNLGQQNIAVLPNRVLSSEYQEYQKNQQNQQPVGERNQPAQPGGGGLNVDEYNVWLTEFKNLEPWAGRLYEI